MQLIPRSPFLDVLRAARQLEAQGRSVVYLSVGEPDFETPGNIKHEGIRAIERGDTRREARA